MVFFVDSALAGHTRNRSHRHRDLWILPAFYSDGFGKTCRKENNFVCNPRQETRPTSTRDLQPPPDFCWRLPFLCEPLSGDWALGAASCEILCGARRAPVFALPVDRQPDRLDCRTHCHRVYRLATGSQEELCNLRSTSAPSFG